MNMKYHIIAFALVGIATVIGMEPANKQKIDFSNPEKAFKILTEKEEFIQILATENQPGKCYPLLDTAYKMLTEHKSRFLQTLLAKEQSGKYCPLLHTAEEVIHRVITTLQDTSYFYHNHKEIPVIWIGNRSRDREHLMDKIVSRNVSYATEEECLDDCDALLECNRYVANAYGSYPPYQDRIITPLHHILAKIADGSLPKGIGKELSGILLSFGSNANARDDAGNTPLHHASSLSLITLLCSYGAKTSKKGYLGRTPLLQNLCLHNWPLVEHLLAYSSTSTINKQDEERNSPLEEAIRSGNREIVQLLLENGADWTLLNGQDLTDLLFGEKSDYLMRVCMINHIEASIRQFVQNDDSKAIERIRKNGLFGLINYDELKQWTMDNFWDATKSDIITGFKHQYNFWKNVDACVTNYAAKNLLKRFEEVYQDRIERAFLPMKTG